MVAVSSMFMVDPWRNITSDNPTPDPLQYHQPRDRQLLYRGSRPKQNSFGNRYFYQINNIGVKFDALQVVSVIKVIQSFLD